MARNNILRFLVLGVMILPWGCSELASTTQPSSVSERQDSALNDPFSYGPGKDFAKEPQKADPVKKDFKSDWDRFWNP